MVPVMGYDLGLCSHLQINGRPLAWIGQSLLMAPVEIGGGCSGLIGRGPIINGWLG